MNSPRSRTLRSARAEPIFGWICIELRGVYYRRVWARFLILVVTFLAVDGSLQARRAADGRVHIRYWEKWTGFEGAAMQAVVDRFNRSQAEIFVHYFTTSQIDRKTLVATAGGDPPDLAGLMSRNIATFAEAAALTPFDEFIEGDGSSPESWLARYYPAYGGACFHGGRVFASVTTPSVMALHWNRALFREVGLDPDRPPRTLAELDEYSRRLTKIDPKTGEILRVGFLPHQPSWWPWAYGPWFGGELEQGGQVTLNHPQTVAAFEWMQGYARQFGRERLQRFISGFGHIASPEASFFSGKVAMVLQGVWFQNFIRQYKPGLDYDIAAWPQAPGGPAGFAIADADVIVIPRGAQHPREAWAFIRYLNAINPDARSRDELRGLEELNFGQAKNSPLQVWSPFFVSAHPNDRIETFRVLSAAAGVHRQPAIGIWPQYLRELAFAMDRVMMLQATPEEALGYAQARVDAAWQRYRRSLIRYGQLQPMSLGETPQP